MPVGILTSHLTVGHLTALLKHFDTLHHKSGQVFEHDGVVSPEKTVAIECQTLDIPAVNINAAVFFNSMPGICCSSEANIDCPFTTKASAL